MKDPNRWLQRLKALPGWAWGGIGLGVIALVLLFMGNPGPTLTTSATGTTSNAPTTSSSTSSAWTAVSVFLKLGLVIILIYITLLALKRWQGVRWGGPARRMTLLETLHLTPRQSVHLIRIGERTLLVGATDHAVQLLTEVALAPAAESLVQETTSPNELPAPEGFTALLKQALSRNNHSNS